MEKLESYPRFNALNLPELAEELENYLNKVDAPKHDGFLFAEDGLLTDELDDVPYFFQAFFGSEKKKIPRSLFFELHDFKDRFEELRRMNSGWFHLKVHGVIEGRMLVTVQCPERDDGMSPENVPVQLTMREWKPKWRFE